MGEEIYTQKLFYGEDRIVNFVLFRVANSFKFIEVYGIVYYNTTNSIRNSKTKNKDYRNCHDELLNIMSIFNFTKNTSDVVFASFELEQRWKKLITPGLDEKNEKFLKKLVREMLNCKNLDKRNKRIVYYLWKNRNKTDIYKKLY